MVAFSSPPAVPQPPPSPGAGAGGTALLHPLEDCLPPAEASDTGAGRVWVQRAVAAVASVEGFLCRPVQPAGEPFARIRAVGMAPLPSGQRSTPLEVPSADPLDSGAPGPAACTQAPGLESMNNSCCAAYQRVRSESSRSNSWMRRSCSRSCLRLACNCGVVCTACPRGTSARGVADSSRDRPCSRQRDPDCNLYVGSGGTEPSR
mmetsp:Transcript_47275/g.141118  ORF Transcript_47275/g.141118 Transcript_47275/m.141118 type:complete len:205 (+) Transcript_47275:398-1012(+)